MCIFIAKIVFKLNSFMARVHILSENASVNIFMLLGQYATSQDIFTSRFKITTVFYKRRFNLFHVLFSYNNIFVNEHESKSKIKRL